MGLAGIAKAEAADTTSLACVCLHVWCVDFRDTKRLSRPKAEHFLLLNTLQQVWGCPQGNDSPLLANTSSSQTPAREMPLLPSKHQGDKVWLHVSKRSLGCTLWDCRVGPCWSLGQISSFPSPVRKGSKIPCQPQAVCPLLQQPLMGFPSSGTLQEKGQTNTLINNQPKLFGPVSMGTAVWLRLICDIVSADNKSNEDTAEQTSNENPSPWAGAPCWGCFPPCSCHFCKGWAWRWKWMAGSMLWSCSFEGAVMSDGRAVIRRMLCVDRKDKKSQGSEVFWLLVFCFGCLSERRGSRLCYNTGMGCFWDALGYVF